MLFGARNASACSASVIPASRRRSTDRTAADGHVIVTEPLGGPFGRTFTFADPDCYRITLHDRA